MFVTKKFKSVYEMTEWLSRSRNLTELKRRYPPEEGYKASINLLENRVEIYDDDVTTIKPEDEFYKEIKKQTEKQLKKITIYIDEETGIIIGMKEKVSRKIPIGLIQKNTLKKLIDHLGVEKAVDDTIERTVPEVVNACRKIFNSNGK